MSDRFTGIPDAAFEFYEGLEADNTKSYWTAHKDVYDNAVRGPVVALGEVLGPEYGPPKVFRPYRDVRFTKDKTPYKTEQGLGFGEDGQAVHYLQVSATGLLLAAGHYQWSPDQIERYRRAVDDERPGGGLQAVVDDLTSDGYEIAGDVMKTKPRGIPDDHPRLALLRHRSLYAHRAYGVPDWLDSPDAVTHIRSAFAALAPLINWLRDNVGASDAPPGRRG